MTLDHPKVKKIIRQCQRRVQKLTGNSAVLIMFHNPQKEIPIETIIDAVSVSTGMTKEDILKRNRKRERVVARQLICFYAKQYSRLCHREIAHKLGYNDHTTSVSGVKVIKGLIESNNEHIIDSVARINQQLNLTS